MGRWLEEMPASTPVTVFAEIASLEEKQSLHRDVRWFVRGESPSLDEALAALPIPAGDTFWWVAVESMCRPHPALVAGRKARYRQGLGEGDRVFSG